MRIKALSLLLLLILCLTMAAPVYATGLTMVSPNTGAVGTTVTVTGGINHAVNTYHIYWDTTLITSGTSASDKSVSTAFVIPESVKGSHTIKLTDPNDHPATEDSRPFTVTPAISLSVPEGAVGATLTVSGTGFTANEGEIKVLYDAVEEKTGISANEYGSWSTSINVPESASGNHIIDASGENTTTTDVDDLNFKVTPEISLDPISGGVGTSIAVTGSGFAASETNIYVTYDVTTVVSNTSSNPKGSWGATFVVPTSKSGSHTVDAYGASTLADDVANASFTVSPTITIDQASGYVGDAINASGSGFAQNETSIQVTFDGVAVKTGITADANGSWTSPLGIPESVSGSHIIDASGQTTPATEVTDASFTVFLK